MKNTLSALIGLFAGLVVGSAVNAAIPVGTNFWYLDPNQPYEGGTTWTGETPFKAGINWATQYSYNSTSKVSNNNPWSTTFLNEITMYRCLRFMDWGATNKSGIISWANRTSPFANQYTVSGGSAGGVNSTNGSGLAYEWMIDLCNRTNKDMWVCIPIKADDNYITNLANLVRDKLKPTLKVYVEYHNELWKGKTINGDSRNTTQYTVQMANQAGITVSTDTDTDRMFKWQVHRSSRIFVLWRNSFGTTNYNNRVRAVIAGQSANLGVGQKILSAINSSVVNPTGIRPYGYAIAPYFGRTIAGSSTLLDGNSANVWTQLDAAIDEQITKTQQNYNIFNPANIKLISYEGGQHILVNAVNPNRNANMYSRYRNRYLPGIDDYLLLFTHYTHVGAFSSGGCWGSKEFTGATATSATQKYRALQNYIQNG